MDILKEAMLIEGELTEHRRYLHRNPQVFFELDKTVKYVAGYLEKIGCEPKLCGKAGVSCVIGKNEGECVLIRADMDALPIEEKTGLPFASQNGNMHACGHDMHTAMLLGCAKILKKYENEIKVPVKLVFQGGEEQLMGACDLIDNGILLNPRVKSAGAVHVMTGTNLDTGTVILAKSGEASPYASIFEITVYGKGTHGAMAVNGIDPVNIICHINSALQSIIANEIGLNERALITVGAIECGRESNVIADRGKMRGSVRSYSSEMQKYLKERIEAVSCNIAMAFKSKAEVSFLGYAPPLLNDEVLRSKALMLLKNLLGVDKVVENTNDKSAGSEDFAHITHKTPSLMLALSAGKSDGGFPNPLHSPETDFDEGALPYGAALYTSLALEILP